MSREIKFRAYYRPHERFIYFTLKTGYLPVVINWPDNWYRNIESWQQYTGLCDKNGREVYEGDICGFNLINFESYRAEYGLIGEVSFEDGQYLFGKSWSFFVQRSSIEVIGNIWQNPELVE